MPALHARLRQAYPFRDLTAPALDAVLEMITGRYRLEAGPEGAAAPARPGHGLTALQPRISWDRVHNRLRALPGSQQLALRGGGTIPDTGQYAVYTQNGVRLGELDEEFVYERRIHDTFVLGTNVWRLVQIDVDPLEFHRSYTAEVTVQADPRAAARQLRGIVDAALKARS